MMTYSIPQIFFPAKDAVSYYSFCEHNVIKIIWDLKNKCWYMIWLALDTIWKASMKSEISIIFFDRVGARDRGVFIFKNGYFDP